jgi:hypothetical protein
MSATDLAKFILYADDTNIMAIGNSEEEVQAKLQYITTLLIKWVDSNVLALNLRKLTSWYSRIDALNSTKLTSI